MPTLGASRSTAPDARLDVTALCAGTVPCGPAALAFDAAGHLWAAMAPNQVVNLSQALAASSPASATAATINGPSIASAAALAFDATGNLWVANGGDDTVVRFNASRLGANITTAADVTLHLQTPGPVVTAITALSALAFDSAGNLWVASFAGNSISQVSVAQQSTSATITPAVILKVGVLALATSLAFDDSQNLWLPGASGTIVRIDHAHLASSGDIGPGDGITLTVNGLGSAESLSFDPGSPKLPLRQ
jgi:ligand-binding sensor domain-containing protein